MFCTLLYVHSSWWEVFCLFCCFTSQVNTYGHGGTVSSLNRTFSWASLNKQLISTSCTYFRLLLTTTFFEWFSGRDENDYKNYFMIHLHESMGPGRGRTHDPWICSLTRICCQTRYQTALRCPTESWLLCIVCLPGVSWWLCGSSSRCHMFVCGLWLWYFLIILTYYL